MTITYKDYWTQVHAIADHMVDEGLNVCCVYETLAGHPMIVNNPKRVVKLSQNPTAYADIHGKLPHRKSADQWMLMALEAMALDVCCRFDSYTNWKA